MVSHGTPRRITQVLAVTGNADAENVITLLRAAGIAPCRMCRRCWRRAPLPPHDPAACFSIAGTPPRTTVRLALTDDTALAASVARLDYGTRHKLLRALHNADSAEHDAEILDTIHEVLARDYLDRTAIGVVFANKERDDGYFLSSTGTVLFDRGDTASVEFDGMDDTFTDEYDCRGPNFTLAVDLRTDTLDVDDSYGGTIHARFCLTPPRHTLDAQDWDAICAHVGVTPPTPR